MFTATGALSRNAPWADIQRVTYELKNSTDTSGRRDLYRSVTRNLLATAAVPDVEDQLMLSGVERVRFTCYDGAQWQETWDTTDVTSVNTNLPLAVRVEIQMAGGNANEPIQLVVPIDSVSRTNAVLTSSFEQLRQHSAGKAENEISTFNIQRPTPNAQRGAGSGSFNVGGSMLKVECSPHSQKGSVLIIVLWVCIGLVSIALYFANQMTYELRASDNRVSGLAADQAIEGAARYVSLVLVNYATNGAVPDPTQFKCAAVPVGDAKFWLIGRDPAEGNSTEPYFGLVDEGGKLNLNNVSTNVFQYLPNMTSDFADAIMDWRGTNGIVSLDYTSLGYQSKNAPFETVDELRLVYGATSDLLAGEDFEPQRRARREAKRI
jgi:hypothetical protein